MDGTYALPASSPSGTQLTGSASLSSTSVASTATSPRSEWSLWLQAIVICFATVPCCSIELPLTLPALLLERYGINVGITSSQLPTLIMFKNGKPVSQRPPVDQQGRVQMKVRFNSVRYTLCTLASVWDAMHCRSQRGVALKVVYCSGV